MNRFYDKMPNGYQESIRKGYNAARRFSGRLSLGYGTPEERTARLSREMETAEAIVVGAGAGLSTSAGLTYSGERFERYFSDFARAYGIQDIYSGGFYPFPDAETRWAWWARHIYYNRFIAPPKPVYQTLLSLLRDRDYFVITTNVVYQVPADGALSMRIPSEMIPKCPDDGSDVVMNLRSDDSFVEDEGWRRASAAYAEFLRKCEKRHVLYLELGVGANTPVIIKYPFWQMTEADKKAVYACVNYGEAFCPDEIEKRSICIDADIYSVLREIPASTSE